MKGYLRFFAFPLFTLTGCGTLSYTELSEEYPECYQKYINYWVYQRECIKDRYQDSNADCIKIYPELQNSRDYFITETCEPFREELKKIQPEDACIVSLNLSKNNLTLEQELEGMNCVLENLGYQAD